MSNTLKDGGPAFPMSGDPNIDFDRGMSLRDYFAAHATDGDIEDNLGGQVNPQTGRCFNQRTREQAKYAYADAMIAAREAQP